MSLSKLSWAQLIWFQWTLGVGLRVGEKGKLVVRQTPLQISREVMVR